MYNTDMPRRAELPSTGKLLRSTVIAALVAAALLVTTVLPAEYGIDPTGIGRALGLTPMGEIKVSLAAEARTEEAVAVAPGAGAQEAPAPVEVAPVEVAPVEVAPVEVAPVEVAPVEVAPVEVAPVEVAAAAAPEPGAGRQDTMTVILKPGQGAEIKLAMNKGDRVRYEWTSAGGPVNFDTHGDPYNAPKNFYHGYGKGRNEPGDTGELVAAFDGNHGWFWRNRSGGDVTVTLKTEGDYTRIERVL